MGTNKRRRSQFSPVTLAFWQLRQTWRLLLVVGAGVIAAVIIVCAVPLYSQIALTAELENALRASNTSSDLLVQSTAGQIAPSDIQRQQNTLDQIVHSTLGDQVIGPTQFSLGMTDMGLYRQETRPSGHAIFAGTGDQLDLIGQPIDQVAPHLSLLAGTLPSAQSSPVDIDIMSGAATSLGARFGGPLKVGSRIVLQVAFDSDQGQRLAVHYITLRVAGIFRPNSDPFWHDNNFDCTPLGQFRQNETCGALASNTAIIAALNAFNNDPKLAGLHVETTPALSWYYHLNIGSINTDNLGQTLQAHNSLYAQITPALNDAPFIESTSLADPIYTVIGLFQSRQAIAQIPLTSISLLVAWPDAFLRGLDDGYARRQTGGCHRRVAQPGSRTLAGVQRVSAARRGDLSDRAGDRAAAGNSAHVAHLSPYAARGGHVGYWRHYDRAAGGHTADRASGVDRGRSRFAGDVFLDRRRGAA